ncbi:MAG: hypothetical protein ACRYFV_03625 [Janthinobacterium lividum]
MLTDYLKGLKLEVNKRLNLRRFHLDEQPDTCRQQHHLRNELARLWLKGKIIGQKAQDVA